VGIQGEWGSGKTSLINSIHHAFDSEEDTKQIWINSWEYSLLSSPEESLLKIINKIIDELLEADGDSRRKETIKEGASKIFKGALRVGAQVALGNEAANVARELLDSSDQSISELRRQLTDLVNDIAARENNPYKKIVVYVDDLDRIEPKNAVAILELLKNIFSVPHCVFILAIDYQVVVKGLEHKFGKQTTENEWEFRAFFDKIIQLPFMMPMGQYNIGKYVNSLLLDIGFVEGEGLDDEAIREIILRTIGGNPRSIKRLVNSVSLIQIFMQKRMALEADEESDDEDSVDNLNEEDEKFLLFALLCLQIAFPQIYSLLVQQPNFSLWDDTLAFKETNRSEENEKELFDREFEIAQQSDDFNEEWERALFRICFVRPRLKPRVADISKFFSYLKDDLLSGRTDSIGEDLAQVLTQTSVTSVTSTDQGQATPQNIQDAGESMLNVSETILSLRPEFKFKGVFKDYLSYQGDQWPARLEFQLISKKRQGIFIVQIGAEKRSARPIADRIHELLPTVQEHLPNLEWEVGPWLSNYDNRVYTEMDIGEVELAAQTYLDLVDCTAEIIDKMLEEEKAKK